MAEVSLGLNTLEAEAAYQREQACWRSWGAMPAWEKEGLMATVRDELIRLADTVENWLPAAAMKTPKRFEILVSLFPTEIGAKSPPLSNLERDQAVNVVDSLATILSELED